MFELTNVTLENGYTDAGGRTVAALGPITSASRLVLKVYNNPATVTAYRMAPEAGVRDPAPLPEVTLQPGVYDWPGVVGFKARNAAPNYPAVVYATLLDRFDPPVTGGLPTGQIVSSTADGAPTMINQPETIFGPVLALGINGLTGTTSWGPFPMRGFRSTVIDLDTSGSVDVTLTWEMSDNPGLPQTTFSFTAGTGKSFTVIRNQGDVLVDLTIAAGAETYDASFLGSNFDPLPASLDGFLHWGVNVDTDALGLTLDGAGPFAFSTGGHNWTNDTGGGDYSLTSQDGDVSIDSHFGDISILTHGTAVNPGSVVIGAAVPRITVNEQGAITLAVLGETLALSSLAPAGLNFTGLGRFAVDVAAGATIAAIQDVIIQSHNSGNTGQSVQLVADTVVILEGKSTGVAVTQGGVTVFLVNGTQALADGIPIKVIGPTGATAGARFAGGTTSGAPVSGTFQVGDFIVARDGNIYVCTVAGSPGAWVPLAGTGGPPSGSAGGVLAGTYPNPDLAAAIAGSGLGFAANVVSVNVDGTTIEINADTLRLKDTAVTPSTYGDASNVGQFTVNAKGQITAASNVSITGSGTVAAADGWIDDTAETWTYASGSGGGTATFTITGDFTAKYSKGTRVKLTQSGNVKYFAVINVSVSSGTTTVTITGGSDYTLANSAISDNYHSYVINPQGYPGWFNWTVAATGFSGTPAVTGRFQIVGKTCTMQVGISGTSNATTFGFTAPVTPVSDTGFGGGTYNLAPRAINNGTAFLGAIVRFDNGTTAVAVVRDAAGTNWTNTGTKQINICVVSCEF